MSTTVDERVVEMTFDNKQFEKNVKESMSTIDKLKKKLNFKGMKDGLDDFQESASKFDLDEMEKAADSVTIKFSKLEAASMRVIHRITDAAYDAGVSMVKSLSVDNVTAGWRKYEAKTANVQTIMNSTGKSIDEVNQYLSKLMWFSDETSFSFSDMTTALATMTASGADIDTIIPTIMGIAEATAYAGKTSSEFGRVIYNLTQSYSQGYLNAMDWKSVALAGVNSKQLIESLIAAGEEVGTIKKGQVTVENFTGSLSDLKWANTKVMEKAFSKWSSMMIDAYELVNGDNAEFDTAAEAIESLSGQYEQYIEDATVAAQSAKSFAEAIAATQDAVSSGWLKTFETIFGDYEEGKKLWSDITEEFWEIFAKSRSERNDVLKAWKKLGGRDLIFANTEESTGAFWTLYYSIKDITDAIGNGFREIFPKQTADQLYQITENIKEFTEKLQLSEESLEKIQNISSKVFGVIKYTLTDIGSIIGYIYKVLAKPIIVKIFDMLPVIGNKFIVPIYRALNTLYGVIDGIVNDFGSQFKDVVSDISGAAKGTISLSSIIEKIGKIIATIIGYAATLLWQIHESELAISIIKGIAKAITTIFDIIKTLFDLISGKSKWSDFVSSFAEIGKNIVVGLGNGIKNAFNIVVEVIKAFANFVINTFKSILGIHSPSTVFEGFGENIGQGLVNGIKKISKVVFDVIKWFGNTIIDIFKEIIDFISGINFSNIIKTSFNKIVSIINTIGSWMSGVFQKSFKSIKNIFSSGLKDTQDTVDKFKDIDTNGIDSFTDKTEKAFHPLSSLLNGVKTVFNGFASAIKKVLEFLSPVFDAIGNLFIKIKNKISDFIHNSNSSDIFDFLTKLINLYTTYGIGKLLNGIGSVGKSLSYALDGIYSALNGFGKKMIMSGIADIIKSIGKSMLELAAAVLILTLIKTDKLKAASIAIGALLAEIIGAISAVLGFSNAAGKGLTPELIKKLTGEALIIRSIGKLIQKMAVSMLIIAVAALIIGKAKPDALTQLGEILLAIVLAALSIVYVVNKSNFTEQDVNKFKDISKLMKAMAGAVLVLAIVAVVMKIVNWTDLAKVGTLLGGAVVAVLGVAIIMTKMNIDATKLDSFTLLVKKLAGAVLVLSIVAIIMKFVNWTDLAKVGVALIGFVGIIVASAYIMTKLNVDSSKLDSFTNLVKKLAGAILILSIVAIIMKFVSWTDLAKVGVTLVGFIAVLVAATVILSKFANSENDKIFDKLGKIMLEFALIILVLAAIAFAITIVSWASLAKVGSILLGFMAVLVATLALYKKINLSEKQMSHLETLLIMFTGVIAAISIIAYLMKEVGWGDLGKVGAVLLGLLIGISALCVIASIVDGSKLESFGKGLLSASIGVLAFAAGVALFAGSLYLLSTVSSDGIETIRNVLTELVLFIPKFIAAVITGLIDAVSMIANKLPELKDDILLIISTIIELLVRAIYDNTVLVVDSLLNFIFTILSTLGEYSYKIVNALFDIISGVMSATFDRMPEIVETIGNILLTVVDKLANIFQNMEVTEFIEALVVVEGMKLLFESMLVTFGVGLLVSLELVAFADKIVEFGEKIEPFLILLSKFDPKVIESAKNLAETIFILTGSSILDAIGSFVGGKDISAFGEEFAKLGPGIKAFGESVKDVDVDTVQKASIAAQSIAAFVNDIPREGGLLQKIIGEIDFKGFAEGLAEFGPAFASYAQSVEGIDKATIQNSTEAAMFITKFAKSIPNTGGLLANLLGDNTLDEFGRQLLVFGPAFAEFSQQMVGIDKSVVETASEAALTVAKFAKEVPNNGGALAKLLGDNRLDDFGEQLKSFGPAFADYAKKMKGISKSNVETASQAALSVAAFAKEIPNSGGALAWLIGDNTLDKFGSQLKEFGAGFADFLEELDSVNVDNKKVMMCTMLGQMMAALQNSLPNTGGVVQWFVGQKDLGQFGKQLANFGAGMASYMNSISGANYDTEKVNASVDVALALSKINEKTSILSNIISWITNTSGLKTLGEGLIPLASGMTEYMNSISNASFDNEKIEASVSAAVALSSINDHTDALSSLIEWFSGDTAYTKLAEGLPDLAEGLVEYGKTIKDSGLTTSDIPLIKQSADIAITLSTISDNIGFIDTIIGAFGGNTSTATFGNDLKKLGTGFSAYANAINTTSFNETQIAASASVIKVLAEAYDVVGSVGSIFDLFSDSAKLNSFAENMTEFAKGICNYGKIIGTSGIDFTTTNFAASVQAVKDLTGIYKLKTDIDKLIEWFTGGKVNTVKSGFTSFGSGMSALGKGLGDFYSNAKDVFSYYETDNGDLVNNASNFAMVIESMKSLGENMTHLGTYFSSGSLSFANLDLFASSFMTMYDKIKDAKVAKVQNIATLIVSVADILGSDDVNKLFGKANQFINIGNSLVTGLVDNINTTANKYLFRAHITDLFSDVISFMESKNGIDLNGNPSPYNSFYNIGKFLVKGLAEGMTSNESKAAIGVSSNTVIDWAEKATSSRAQVKSPSRLFAEIGKYLTEGLALGMVDTEATLMLVGSIAKIVDMVENNVDAQPTIRPVMDLTEIQNGVKLANSVTAGLNGAYVTGSYNMASDTAYRANLRQAELNNASNVSVASEVGRILGEVVASNGTTFNNTFNITGDDPEEIAEEVSRIIQQDMERRNAVWA